LSYAMKVAKSQAMGDPGLFGFLGKVVGAVGKVASIIPGPLGVVGRVATALTSGGAKPIKLASTGSLPGIGGPTVRLPGTPINIPLPQGGFFRGNETQAGPGSVATGALVGTPIRAPGAQCTPGYHYNRTAYFTKRYGLIEKGTVCVRNRKRNPLNPRALSRAMSRLASAKKAARCLADFSIRPKKACGCR